MVRNCILPLVLITIFLSSPASAAIDKLQKEDAQRLVVGLMNLYYNIGKGFVGYCKDTVYAIPDLPKAIATDVFQVGQKGVPSYYQTEQEKKELEKQERMEKTLKKEEKKLQQKEGGQGITSIEKR
ncbi:MAG: hypothetical protein NTZ78_10270 [Candidatus Aureabacteria bacterium]|nr:hypothetical protein [Candidatus Auribacterota bacterium]